MVQGCVCLVRAHRPLGCGLVATVAFDRAARHHAGDALELLKLGRHPGADHLAGLAAECALKAILIGFFGVSTNPSGDVADRAYQKHLDRLWPIFQSRVAGNTAIAGLVSAPGHNATVQRWDVRDRYCAGVRWAMTRPGSTITVSCTVRYCGGMTCGW